MGSLGDILYQQGEYDREILYHLTFFFFLCAEGLSTLIQKSVENGESEGLSVCRGSPTLSHIFLIALSLVKPPLKNVPLYKESLMFMNRHLGSN